MTTHTLIENVSRRSFLKSSAAHGRVRAGDAAGALPAQAMAYATGADGMPHGTVNDPTCSSRSTPRDW